MPEAASANPNATEDLFQKIVDAAPASADTPAAAPKQAAAASQASAPDPAPQVAADDPAIAAAAAAAPEASAEEPAADETPDYVNVEDYLQKSGIERESFLALPIRVKVDGKESDVPLADVVKGFQLEKHFQAKSIAFAEQQKAWEAQTAQARDALGAQLKNAQVLGNIAHQELLGQYQAIDWNKLRIDDPAQWAVLDREFNNRAAAIQQQLGAVTAEQQRLAQEAQQQLLATLPKEREFMFNVHPEWRDEKSFQSARSDMLDSAKKYGFSEADLTGIYDHRIMLALHDLARFAKIQAQAPVAAKRVRAAPQVSAPGARMTRDPTQVAKNQARDRFLKNRRDPDAGAAYFETLVPH